MPYPTSSIIVSCYCCPMPCYNCIHCEHYPPGWALTDSGFSDQMPPEAVTCAANNFSGHVLPMQGVFKSEVFNGAFPPVGVPTGEYGPGAECVYYPYNYYRNTGFSGPCGPSPPDSGNTCTLSPDYGPALYWLAGNWYLRIGFPAIIPGTTNPRVVYLYGPIAQADFVCCGTNEFAFDKCFWVSDDEPGAEHDVSPTTYCAGYPSTVTIVPAPIAPQQTVPCPCLGTAPCGGCEWPVSMHGVFTGPFLGGLTIVLNYDPAAPNWSGFTSFTMPNGQIGTLEVTLFCIEDLPSINVVLSGECDPGTGLESCSDGAFSVAPSVYNCSPFHVSATFNMVNSGGIFSVGCDTCTHGESFGPVTLDLTA